MFFKTISIFFMAIITTVHGMNVNLVPAELIIHIACLLNNPNPYDNNFSTINQHTADTLFLILQNKENACSKNNFTSFKISCKRLHSVLETFIKKHEELINSLPSLIKPETLYNYFATYKNNVFFNFDSNIDLLTEKTYIKPSKRNEYRFIFDVIIEKKDSNIQLICNLNESMNTHSVSSHDFTIRLFPSCKDLIPIIDQHITHEKVMSYISSLTILSEQHPTSSLPEERYTIKKTFIQAIEKDIPVDLFKSICYQD